MHVVWDVGEATVNDVWKTLAAERGLARNTVQTTMTRLAEKGWLRTRRRGQAFVYRPSVPRDETVRVLAARLVNTAFGGSVEGLVMALLEEHELSADEARRIRALIERSERERS